MDTLRAVTTITILVILLCEHANSARILGLFAFSGKSHNNVFSALTTALAERGHEVTVVTPFPLKKDIKNFKEITFPFVDEMMKNMTASNSMLNPSEAKKMSIMSTLNMLLTFSENICDSNLADQQMQDLIHSEKTFDVMIVSMFFNECFYGFSYKKKIPMIVMSPAGVFSWINNAIGNPDIYSYSPNIFLPFSDRMNFLERGINAILGVGLIALRHFYHIPTMEKIARKHFGEDMPPIEDIERNMSLVLLNNHFTLSYPRPYLPNIVEVGGLHLKPAKALPQDLKKFLDEAKDGVIYFSMGSALRGDQIPEEKRQIFLDVFAQLPQRVIWKFESELPNMPKNLKIGPWLPQSDILAHPNVRAFITHGGLLGTTEAVYHGVPLIGLPIFGDQNLNVNRMEKLGIAYALDLTTMTKEELLHALKEVLNKPSYRENTRKLSARFKDQPETPLERAVYWTEYVIRHKGATHLRSAAQELSWYQYFLLDVIAVIALTVFIVLGTAYLVLRTLCRLVCGKKASTSAKSKQKKSKSKRE